MMDKEVIELIKQSKCFTKFCDKFDCSCDTCPIAPMLESMEYNIEDCEELYLFIKYPHLIHSLDYEEIQKIIHWTGFCRNCDKCKLQELGKNNEYCHVFSDLLLTMKKNGAFKTMEYTHDTTALSNEKVLSRMNAIEKKIDLILQELLKK